MPFGQQAGSLKNLKKNLAKSSGGGKGFIKFIPKGGPLNVRFITEPEGWLSYGEHFDPAVRKSYPCTTEADCPGCRLGLDKKNKYLANVVNLDNNDRVTALQLPISLVNRLVVKYEKWGSLVNREMELSKEGADLDTTYDFDYSPEDNVRVDKWTPLNLEEVLQAAFDDVFGDADDDDVPRPQAKEPALPRKRAAAPRRAAEEPPEEPEEKEPPKRKRSEAAPRKASEPEFTPDDDDDVDQDLTFTPDDDDSVPEGDDQDGYTEDELARMSLPQLRKVAREEFEINPRGMDQAEIIDAIFADA